MDFFEKIGEKITSTSKDVAKKTKELADITKINAQIGNEEDNIKNMHSQIGKLYYELFSTNPDEPFVSLCASIMESQNKINAYREQIQTIKGVKKCSGCGAEIANSSVFCAICGCKINTNEEGVNDDMSQSKCPSCAKPITDEMVFCTGCGNKLK